MCASVRLAVAVLSPFPPPSLPPSGSLSFPLVAGWTTLRPPPLPSSPFPPTLRRLSSLSPLPSHSSLPLVWFFKEGWPGKGVWRSLLPLLGGKVGLLTSWLACLRTPTTHSDFSVLWHCLLFPPSDLLSFLTCAGARSTVASPPVSYLSPAPAISARPRAVGAVIALPVPTEAVSTEPRLLCDDMRVGACVCVCVCMWPWVVAPADASNRSISCPAGKRQSVRIFFSCCGCCSLSICGCTQDRSRTNARVSVIGEGREEKAQNTNGVRLRGTWALPLRPVLEKVSWLVVAPATRSASLSSRRPQDCPPPWPGGFTFAQR